MQQKILENISTIGRLDPRLLFDAQSTKEQKIAELSDYLSGMAGISELVEQLREHYSGPKFTNDEMYDLLLTACSYLGGEYNFRFDLGEDLERVLEFVCSNERYSVYDFMKLIDGSILETTSGLRIRQFSLDNAITLASHYYNKPQDQIVRIWADTSHELVTKYGPGKIPFPEKFQEIVERRLLGSISKSDRIIYTDQLNSLFYLDPPWIVFDYPPGSMSWRMGGGEDYMSKWHSYFEALDERARDRYLGLCNVPSEWKDWMSKLF